MPREVELFHIELRTCQRLIIKQRIHQINSSQGTLFTRIFLIHKQGTMN